MISATQKRRTRLAELVIAETSGVDHPANAPQVGGEGWLVMKADGSGLDPETVEAIVRATGKGAACSTPGCGLWALPDSACPVGHVQTGAPAPAEPAVHPQTAAAIAAWEANGGPAVVAGTVNGAPVTKSSVFAQIEKAGAALRAREPALTREQAIAKATELDPELADAYRTAAVDAPVRKAAPPPRPGADAADRLDRLAAQLAKAAGVPHHRGFDLAAATPEGRRLAAEHYALVGNIAKARQLA